MPTLSYEPQVAPRNPLATSSAIAGWTIIAALAAELAMLVVFIMKRNGAISRAAFAPWEVPLIVVASVCGLVAIIGPFIWFSIRSDANRIALFLKAFHQGNFLVRWNYPTDQWKQFVGDDQRRHAMRWDLIVLGALALLAAMTLLVLMQFGGFRDNPSAREMLWYIMLGIEAFLLLLAIALQIGHRARTHRLANPQPTLLCTLGAHVNGHWFLWGTATRRLKSVRVVHEQNVPLAIVIAVAIGDTTQTERILVPTGQLEIARKVAHAIEHHPAAQEGGGLNDALSIMQLIASILRIFK